MQVQEKLCQYESVKNGVFGLIFLEDWNKKVKSFFCWKNLMYEISWTKSASECGTIVLNNFCDEHSAQVQAECKLITYSAQKMLFEYSLVICLFVLKHWVYEIRFLL